MKECPLCSLDTASSSGCSDSSSDSRSNNRDDSRPLALNPPGRQCSNLKKGTSSSRNSLRMRDGETNAVWTVNPPPPPRPMRNTQATPQSYPPPPPPRRKNTPHPTATAKSRKRVNPIIIKEENGSIPSHEKYSTSIAATAHEQPEPKQQHQPAIEIKEENAGTNNFYQDDDYDDNDHIDSDGEYDESDYDENDYDESDYGDSDYGDDDERRSIALDLLIKKQKQRLLELTIMSRATSSTSSSSSNTTNTATSSSSSRHKSGNSSSATTSTHDDDALEKKNNSKTIRSSRSSSGRRGSEGSSTSIETMNAIKKSSMFSAETDQVCNGDRKRRGNAPRKTSSHRTSGTKHEASVLEISYDSFVDAKYHHEYYSKLFNSLQPSPASALSASSRTSTTNKKAMFDNHCKTINEEVCNNDEVEEESNLFATNNKSSRNLRYYGKEKGGIRKKSSRSNSIGSSSRHSGSGEKETSCNDSKSSRYSSSSNHSNHSNHSNDRSSVSSNTTGVISYSEISNLTDNTGASSNGEGDGATSSLSRRIDNCEDDTSSTNTSSTRSNCGEDDGYYDDDYDNESNFSEDDNTSCGGASISLSSTIFDESPQPDDNSGADNLSFDAECDENSMESSSSSTSSSSSSSEASSSSSSSQSSRRREVAMVQHQSVISPSLGSSVGCSSSGSSHSKLLVGLNTGEFDSQGRCIRHPHIRLRKKRVMGGWKVVSTLSI